MYYKLIFVYGFVLFIVSGCQCNFKTLTCPNGEPVVITDIDHAFPVYAPSYEIGLKATLKKLDTLEVTADADTKREILMTREKLNQESAKFQDALKVALLGLQTSPCDPAARVRFSELLIKINERGNKLNAEVGIVGQELKMSLGEIKVTIDQENKK